MTVAWHTLSPTGLSQQLRVDCDDGVSGIETQRRLLTHRDEMLSHDVIRV